MIININRENEIISQYKCYFDEIEQICQIDKWLLIQFSGLLFIIRKNDLKVNSIIFSYMYKNPNKTIQTTIQNKWMITSIILFIASLFSIFGALLLVKTASTMNNLPVENMWLFFTFTPIPIASVIFGYILKAKGYKYKKNIIAGIIMTFILCVYGSFAFII